METDEIERVMVLAQMLGARSIEFVDKFEPQPDGITTVRSCGFKVEFDQFTVDMVF